MPWARSLRALRALPPAARHGSLARTRKYIDAEGEQDMGH